MELTVADTDKTTKSSSSFSDGVGFALGIFVAALIIVGFFTLLSWGTAGGRTIATTVSGFQSGCHEGNSGPRPPGPGWTPARHPTRGVCEWFRPRGR